MRILFFGGTFDPVHNGHLQIARDVANGLCDIDTIMYVPAGNPWMKFDRKITDAKHRFEMLMCAAIEPKEYVLPYEVFNDEPSYTYDTIKMLKDTRCKPTIYLLIGADVVHEFHRWYLVRELLDMVQVIVAQRSSTPIPNLSPSLPREKFSFIENNMSEISSTVIRARVRAGQDIGGLVPPAVEEYIRNERLYL